MAEMRRSGGLITREDLAGYRARWRKPVRTSYRKARIVSMPPPSSGGIVLAGILKQLEGFDLRRSGFGSWRTYHVMAEAMRRAYADRAKHLGDPDFHHTPHPLTQPAYWVARRRDIIADRASPSTSIKPGKLPVREKEETTHYSVVDSEGNAISATTTLNGSFGSKLSIAGFLLNNEMDDFSVKPGVPNQFGLVGGKANEVQPGKRMLSSMTPTLVFNGEGRLLLVLGSPGGSKIITTVLQVILNVLDHEMNLQQAVDAQRIHHQWLPDKLWLEKGGLYSPDTLARLKAIGHTLAYRKPMGRVQAIQLEWSSTRIRRFLGASDSRSSGLAAGLQK